METAQVAEDAINVLFNGEGSPRYPHLFAWFQLTDFLHSLCATRDAQKSFAPSIKIAQKIMKMIKFCAILHLLVRKSYAI